LITPFLVGENEKAYSSSLRRKRRIGFVKELKS
jgi:hypothetical protein